MRRFSPSIEGIERRQLRAAMPVPAANADALPATYIAPPTGETFPFIPAPGQPTAFEQARQRFTASFTGKFGVGPAQFTSQSGVLHMRGVGSSTQYLHGNIQMLVGLPATPGGPIAGGAYLQDKNISGSTELGLDINFDPASVNAQGLPTRGAWAADPNVYSGIDFVAQGTGTVTIRYSKNTMTIVFSGKLYTNGISNPLGNTDIQP